MNTKVTPETLAFLKRRSSEAAEVVKKLRQRQENLASELREAERGLATWQDAYTRACQEAGTSPDLGGAPEQTVVSHQNGKVPGLHGDGERKMPRPNSIPSLAREALRKAARPMSTEEILQHLAKMGKQTGAASVDSMLIRYRNIFRRQPDSSWGLVNMTASTK